MMNDPRDIYIIGAGGLGREVLALIRKLNNFNLDTPWIVKGFVDQVYGHVCTGMPVISHEQFKQLKNPRSAVLAIGLPDSRNKVIDYYTDAQNISYPALIHPSVVLEDPDSIEIGVGCVICANVVITTNVTLRDYNYINLCCTIGHDAVIEENCVLNPSVNISGEVVVGRNTLIGTGAQVLQQLSIGPDAKVGAGAVVVKNVEAGRTVVGVPAKAVNR